MSVFCRSAPFQLTVGVVLISSLLSVPAHLPSFIMNLYQVAQLSVIPCNKRIRCGHLTISAVELNILKCSAN